MKKMLEEVKAIAKANSVDLDRAFDMFRSNSESKKENYKGTGTFDYSEVISDSAFGELRKSVLEYDRKKK